MIPVYDTKTCVPAERAYMCSCSTGGGQGAARTARRRRRGPRGGGGGRHPPPKKTSYSQEVFRTNRNIKNQRKLSQNQNSTSVLH